MKCIAANPVDEIQIIVPRAEVPVLRIDQTEALLRAGEAFKNSASVVPYLAIGLYAGLRPTEAELLCWERIDFAAKQIKVLGSTSKTRETRYVHMEETLIAWLLAYRKRSGLIIGSNLDKDLKAVKAKAGFGSGEGREPWAPDVMRHSYASHWLPIYKDRAHLAEEMGNSVEVIRKNYRRAIPEEIARKYWALRPGRGPGKVVRLPAAAQNCRESLLFFEPRLAIFLALNNDEGYGEGPLTDRSLHQCSGSDSLE